MFPCMFLVGGELALMLRKTRSSLGYRSRDSRSKSLMGLLKPKAPSTNVSPRGPIAIGSKRVEAALVALAASHILQCLFIRFSLLGLM
jgi:hypothetical protein